MKHALIVHGYKSSPETNWKPWLRQELKKQSFKVDVPKMPDADKPVASSWVRTLAEAVHEPTQETYLIGHSLGCITILRYLESLSEGQEVGGCILVAGFGGEFQKYKGGHDSFFDHELDWQRVKEHCSNFVVIHSDDDANVEFEQLEVLRQNLNAKAIGVHGMGHFGSADGVFEVPIVRDELLALAESVMPSS